LEGEVGRKREERRRAIEREVLLRRGRKGKRRRIRRFLVEDGS